MKNKMFDFRLYLQGLNRLRVIGLALAILCITVCILLPIYHWHQTPPELRYFAPLDGEDVILKLNSKEKLSENLDWEVKFFTRQVGLSKLIPFVAITSYFSPILVMIMFAYLHKRKEADFYHAIPLTRTCVFVSFVAATMTWMWSIMIVGALLSALVWTLCPYYTFSFGTLLAHLLYALLNAALLAAITTVAVSLTGTTATAVVATLLLGGVGRIVLYIFKECVDGKLRIIPSYALWNEFLSQEFFLPVVLMDQGTPYLDGSVLYALILTVVLFALGGFLYVKRRSELAERAVPGRWVHSLLRCLITLPFAVLLTSKIVDKDDFIIKLILFVCTLLVFYLYELLTTKKVGSMLRATPWLGAVLCACVIFVGGVHVTDYIEEHERTDADRIRAVTVLDGHSLNQYERAQIALGMSDDEQAIELVAKAWANTQQEYLKGHWGMNGDWEQVRVRIQLKSGRCVQRRVRMSNADETALMVALKKDMGVKTVPDDADVIRMDLYSQESGTIHISGEWREYILEAMRRDGYFAKAHFNGNTDAPYIRVTVKVGDEEQIYQKNLDHKASNTFSAVYELYRLPAYQRAARAYSAIDKMYLKGAEVRVISAEGSSVIYYARGGRKETLELQELLRKVVHKGEEDGGNQYVLLYIKLSSESVGFFVPAEMTKSERDALVTLTSIPKQ